MADFPAALNWLETDWRLLSEVRDTVNSNEDFRMFERFLSIHDDDRGVEFSQICGYEEVKRKLFHISLTTGSTFSGFQVEGAGKPEFFHKSILMFGPSGTKRVVAHCENEKILPCPNIATFDFSLIVR